MSYNTSIKAVLRVVGWVILIAGVVGGFYGAAETGGWFAAVVFISAVVAGIIGATFHFWMAQLIANQEELISLLRTKKSAARPTASPETVMSADSCRFCGGQLDGEYCSTCEKSQAEFCSSCLHKNPPDAEFCGHCLKGL
ncbi:MAG: hypothetical protein LBE35_05605 [Clostridiales bacterium]|jgi:hypothetical protein|nr:hypothetical protein [Clostridiales bacterium]